MPEKKFTDYVAEAPEWWDSSLSDYTDSPASTFLRECVHIWDAFNTCKRRFSKKNDGSYTKDSQDSLFRISAAALSSMMGQFETFQRFLFAGAVEATRFIPTFDVDKLCTRLQKDSSVNVTLKHLAAYRGEPASIGRLWADNLPGWHNPDRVNQHFAAILPDIQFYGRKEVRKLQTLWQLRHSIVHTGGWLTRADSQKVAGLGDLAGKPILLNDSFIDAASRRLHSIVNSATNRFGDRFLERLDDDLEDAQVATTTKLFLVESPRASWLK